MEELRKIVVGVELHGRTNEARDGAARAVRQAAWLAARNGGELVLVHSTWDGRDEPAPDPDDKALESLDGLRAMAESEGAAARFVVDRERPWLAIAARAANADLVVAGKRDAGSVDGSRVGPTAAKLLRACSTPVWLVEPDQDLSLQLVLACTDLSPIGERAVQAAAWLAEANGAELHVLHSWRMPRAFQKGASEMEEDEYQAAVEEHRAKALSALEHAADGLAVDPTLHLKRGPASAKILDRVESLQPDLVVMGSLSRGGRPGLFVGETAERVVPKLEASVLTFKPRLPAGAALEAR